MVPYKVTLALHGSEPRRPVASQNRLCGAAECVSAGRRIRPEE